MTASRRLVPGLEWQLVRFPSLVVLLAGLAPWTPAVRGQETGHRPDLAAVADSELARLSPERERPYRFGPVIGSHRLRGLRPEVVAALFAPDAGELPIEVLAVPLAPEDDGSGPTAAERALGLLVEIDGADFLRYNQAEVSRIEVYAYALANGTRVAGHLAEMFTVDVAALGESIWQGGLKFHGGLRLAPGDYELRVLVRNFHSGAMGLRRAQVEIPGSPILAFPPPSSRDGWLPVESPLFREMTTPYPFVAAGIPIDPAALPVLVSGRVATGFLFPTDSSPDTSATAGRVEISPGGQASEGHLPQETEAQAVPLTAVAEGRIEPSGDGSGSGLIFEVPEMAPGRYRARWVSEGLSTPWAPVAVVGAQTQERGLLWSDLRWMLRPGADAVVAPGTAAADRATAASDGSRETRQASGRAVKRLAARYRQALAGFDTVSPEDLRSGLYALESEILGRGDRKSLLRLRTAELSVAEDLAKRDPKALVPLILLHSQLSEQYRSRRIFSLVAHARAMVELLAELHAEVGGPARLTASVLAVQGSSLQRANLVAGSRRLFSRALEHDPDSASALLGLAASFEKYADYNRAIEYLERLVAARPDLDEATLRLAINQARVGWLPRARQGLETIVAKDQDDWVSVVALEELARTFLIGGDLERAVATLEPAVDEMPQRAGLRLLLAHLYDRQGRVGSALELASGVGVSAGTNSSARRHYDEWPRRAVVSDLEWLRTQAQKLGPALTSGLAAATARE